MGIKDIVNVRSFGRFSSKRSTQLGLNSLLMIVFFILSIVFLNLIISNWYFRYDFSANRSFTLSPQSENVARRLDKEIEIIAFIQATERNYKMVSSLLEGYRYFNEKIDYTVYDLDAVPGLAQKYGVRDYNTLVVTNGKKIVREVGITEEKITNSIIKISRKGTKKIYFLQGHGERGINDNARGGIGRAVNSLRDMGYVVEGLNLKGTETIPWDGSLIIIAGPSVEYSQEDINKLRSYAKGGRLVILIDYEGARLRDFFLDYGIFFSSGLIIDKNKHLAGAEYTVPLVDEYPPTAITRYFNLTTFYPTAMAVKKGTGLEHWYEYIPIVKSSDNSLVKSNEKLNENANTKGPVTIGMFVKSRRDISRLVVFGDSDFISNEYIDISGNGNLFRNIVSYLVGESDLVSIEPVKTEFIPLYITDKQAEVVTYVFGISLPLIVVLTGTIVWLRRRRL